MAAPPAGTKLSPAASPARQLSPATSPVRTAELSPAAGTGMQNNGENENDTLEELVIAEPQPPKIDINALKNEILTDGMQVSAKGYVCTYIYI